RRAGAEFANNMRIGGRGAGVPARAPGAGPRERSDAASSFVPAPRTHHLLARAAAFNIALLSALLLAGCGHPDPSSIGPAAGGATVPMRYQDVTDQAGIRF